MPIVCVCLQVENAYVSLTWQSMYLVSLPARRNRKNNHLLRTAPVWFTTKMYECETCTETFWDQDDCHDHMNDYDHWPECETCTKTFRTQRACNQHMNATDHWAPRFECETCTHEFRSQNAANQHMTAVGHWAPKIPCETCGKKFHTQSAANQHMNVLAHYKNYCKDCGQKFQNENNLRMVRLAHAHMALQRA
jgi:hypothetical protein